MLLTKGDYKGHPFRGNQYTTRNWNDRLDLEDEAPYSSAEKKVLTKLYDLAGTADFWDEIDFREDPDITPQLLDQRGESFKGKKAIQVYKTDKMMLPNECHYNTTELYKDGRAKKIVTGFAYTAGDEPAMNMWVQHTWGLDSKGRVLEPTAPRDLYFGVILNEEETAEFIEVNGSDT